MQRVVRARAALRQRRVQYERMLHKRLHCGGCSVLDHEHRSDSNVQHRQQWVHRMDNEFDVWIACLRTVRRCRLR